MLIDFHMMLGKNQWDTASTRNAGPPPDYTQPSVCVLVHAIKHSMSMGGDILAGPHTFRAVYLG